MPSQKLGIETPSRPNVSPTPSHLVPRLTALSVPAGMATDSETTNPASVTNSVVGSRETMAALTSWLLTYDRPKSPASTSVM